MDIAVSFALLVIGGDARIVVEHRDRFCWFWLWSTSGSSCRPGRGVVRWSTKLKRLMTTLVGDMTDPDLDVCSALW